MAVVTAVEPMSSAAAAVALPCNSSSSGESSGSDYSGNLVSTASTAWSDRNENLSKSLSAFTISSVIGEGSVGRIGTVLNIMSVVIGSSVLQLGVVMKETGLIAGVACMVVTSAICCWTFTMIPQLIIRSLEIIPEHEREGEPLDLPLIGLAAFGKPGKAAMTVFFVLDLSMTALVVQVTCGSCLHTLFPALSKEMLIAIGGISGVFMQMIPERHLSMASAGGVFAVILFVLSVLISGSVVEEREPRAWSAYTMVNLERIPASFAMMALANIAHSQSVTVYKDAKRKSVFNLCAVAAFGAALLIFIAVGLMGYLAYGEDVPDNLMEKIGLDAEGFPIEGLTWLRKLVAALFCMKLQVSTPFFLIPLSEQLGAGFAYLATLRRSGGADEEAASKAPDAPVAVEVDVAAPTGVSDDLEHGVSKADTMSTAASNEEPTKDAQDAASSAAEQPKASSRLQQVTVRCALAVAVIGLAIVFAESLEQLSDFTGAIIGIGLTVTFAPFFQLVLFRGTLSIGKTIVLGSLAFVGFSMQIMGVHAAIFG